MAFKCKMVQNLDVPNEVETIFAKWEMIIEQKALNNSNFDFRERVEVLFEEE